MVGKNLYVRPIFDKIDEENGMVYVQLGERRGYIGRYSGIDVDGLRSVYGINGKIGRLVIPLHQKNNHKLLIHNT